MPVQTNAGSCSAQTKIATEAIAHFKEAQRLNPKSWNYKRQAYALSSEKDYGTTFRDEVQKILRGETKKGTIPPLWDGHAAERIASILAGA